MLSAQTLEERRLKLCLNFARKNLKSPNSFFTTIEPKINTRGRKSVVKQYKCRTDRFQKSSLPYLAKLLNQNSKTRAKQKCWRTVTCGQWGHSLANCFVCFSSHRFTMLCLLPLVIVRHYYYYYRYQPPPPLSPPITQDLINKLGLSCAKLSKASAICH